MAKNSKAIGKSKGVQRTPTGERQIADIEIDLDNALRAEAKNLFIIGALLIEAKDKVAHGEWMPWLGKNFAQSVSTAQNYMNAARLLAKFPTVGNLKLTLGAIYYLARAQDEVDEEVFEQALANISVTAKTELVGEVSCAWNFETAAQRVEKKRKQRRRDRGEESSAPSDEPAPDEPAPDEPADEPAPDEPARQGLHLVSSDGISAAEAAAQAAAKEAVQEMFRDAVKTLHDLIPELADYLEGVDVGLYNDDLIETVNFLATFVDLKADLGNYHLILRCLHPDTRSNMAATDLDRAFDFANKIFPPAARLSDEDLRGKLEGDKQL